MTELSAAIFEVGRALTKRATESQGGLLNGQDPTVYNTADPLRIWIIQLGIITFTCQFLSFFLRKIKQPQVIAEVIGGILLGPTAFGRIPGFTEHIFPSASLPYLSLTAQIGLCLFLFIIGLEIDTSIILRNARVSPLIALTGITLPFGLGAALSIPLYHEFIGSSVKFTHYMLFTGVAYSITAFPVLCRILTELKLLDTTVGIVVLSAGVVDDIVGWCLLALSVALVNAGSGLTALWIVLICFAWVLVMLFPVKRVLRLLAVRTGSIENGPTMAFTTITILVVFSSAFFTDIVGVQAIFGAFLTGLAVPREGGLAIALTEKLEDMVTIIFLPLYFTLSGLSTNLGLLDNGITWGFTIAIIALSYTGKFGGCMSAARLLGFSWREASTIGTLMSCKGLVELIVLNAGLSAGILNQRVFSMFVFEAVVLTFMTTPVASFLYPPERRVRAASTRASSASGGKGDPERGSGSPVSEIGSGHPVFKWKSHFTVVLDKVEHLSAIMGMAQLMLQPRSKAPSAIDGSKTREYDVSVDALRLIELSDRTSDVMKGVAIDTLVKTDALLGAFKTFGELNDLTISESLAVLNHNELAVEVIEHAQSQSSQLILLPWLFMPSTKDGGQPLPPNPFNALFHTTSSDRVMQSNFIQTVFSQATTDVALFLDKSLAMKCSKNGGSNHHLLMPFFGGPDDRLALQLVVQWCADPRVSATVIRYRSKESIGLDSLSVPKKAFFLGAQTLQHDSLVSTPDVVSTPETTHAHIDSEKTDNIMWAQYTHSRTADSLPQLARIEFQVTDTPIPIQSLIRQAQLSSTSVATRRSRLVAVTGRTRHPKTRNYDLEISKMLDEYGPGALEVRKTAGDVGSALVYATPSTGVVVVQAAV